MRILAGLIVFAAACLPSIASAQLPPGYWSYYDADNAHYHRHRSNYELEKQRPPSAAAQEPWRDRSQPADPMSYEGRGMTGQGLSSYQSNGYSGAYQNNYYGYWDGGFNPGLYGFSLYPHFNRPGFTYWRY